MTLKLKLVLAGAAAIALTLLFQPRDNRPEIEAALDSASARVAHVHEGVLARRARFTRDSLAASQTHAAAIHKVDSVVNVLPQLAITPPPSPASPDTTICWTLIAFRQWKLNFDSALARERAAAAYEIGIRDELIRKQNIAYDSVHALYITADSLARVRVREPFITVRPGAFAGIDLFTHHPDFGVGVVLTVRLPRIPLLTKRR